MLNDLLILFKNRISIKTTEIVKFIRFTCEQIRFLDYTILFTIVLIYQNSKFNCHSESKFVFIYFTTIIIFFTFWPFFLCLFGTIQGFIFHRILLLLHIVVYIDDKLYLLHILSQLAQVLYRNLFDAGFNDNYLTNLALRVH
jgi:hypothetical protein